MQYLVSYAEGVRVEWGGVLECVDLEVVIFLRHITSNPLVLTAPSLVQVWVRYANHNNVLYTAGYYMITSKCASNIALCASACVSDRLPL